MKYYKDNQNNEVFAYELDGSQDEFIGDKILMTDEEINIHLSPLKTLEDMIQHFESITTQYIQSKVDEYNVANGLAFTNVHSCANYKDSLTYSHAPFCKRVWDWNERVWDTVRDYQATATAFPTDEEFKAVLDGVVF